MQTEIDATIKLLRDDERGFVDMMTQTLINQVAIMEHLRPKDLCEQVALPINELAELLKSCGLPQDKFTIGAIDNSYFVYCQRKKDLKKVPKFFKGYAMEAVYTGKWKLA